MKKILLIDDDVNFLKVYKKILIQRGYDVATLDIPLDTLALLKKENFTLVITDMMMPKINGLELLREIKKEFEEIDVIILTGEGSVESAVTAMKEGAYTYLTKPVNIDELLMEIEKCLYLQSLREENKYLKEKILQGQDEFLGDSIQVKEIKEKIRIAAPTDATILITGESGTGKELAAELVHNNSNRKDKSFIKVNCAALVESVLESELFGHEKGAFTGALTEHKGRFELANTGTLFLDEIGEVSLNMQTKLLRVLQEKEFERVGGMKTIKTNFRLIAATNKDLKKEVEEGRFREDLYYRLNVIPIHLSPLRERTEDIPLLLQYFLKKFSKEMNKNIKAFGSDTEFLLKQYAWPGNVRELKNIVERLVVFTQGTAIIDVQYLPSEIYSKDCAPKSLSTFQEARQKFERSFLKESLNRNGWNISRTAKEIGLARKNLQIKIKQYQLKDVEGAT
ncbi:sigma-54 dependent transcriptional regulator [Clostridiaceae bacterium 35-E11]